MYPGKSERKRTYDVSAKQAKTHSGYKTCERHKNSNPSHDLDENVCWMDQGHTQEY